MGGLLLPGVPPDRAYGLSRSGKSNVIVGTC
ncbi:conserved hypothetical protein [Candidatus Terasakiella magnetica]|nr:conserved hypothetical protein [Candidatus Terasakiella magnetica]